MTKSHYRPGDTLFSETGRKCGCGWETFWAHGQGETRYDLAYCERCGAFVPSVKPAPQVPRCRNCHEPIPGDLVRDGADACSLQCVREYVIRGRGRS